MNITVILMKVLKDIFVSFVCEKIIANLAWKLLGTITSGLVKWSKSTSNQLDDSTALSLHESVGMAKAKYYGTKESIPTIHVQN